MAPKICNTVNMFILCINLYFLSICQSTAIDVIDVDITDIISSPLRTSETLNSYLQQLANNQKFLLSEVDHLISERNYQRSLTKTLTMDVGRLNSELDSQKTLTENLRMELAHQKVMSERLSIDIARLNTQLREQEGETRHIQYTGTMPKQLKTKLKTVNYRQKHLLNQGYKQSRVHYGFLKVPTTSTPKEYLYFIESSNSTSVHEIADARPTGQSFHDVKVSSDKKKLAHEDVNDILLNKRVDAQPLERVAFTTISNDLTDLTRGQTIVFGNIVSNIGNAYSGHTGVFACSVPGVYVFFVHIVSESGKHFYGSLYKNGSKMNVDLYSSAISGQYGSSSNVAILSLQRGDRVEIRTLESYPGPAVDNDSSFSGFLLYPDL